MKEELNTILDQLIELGEDKDELEYWRSIFEDLPADKQAEVFLLFKKELEQLEALENKKT